MSQGPRQNKRSLHLSQSERSVQEVPQIRGDGCCQLPQWQGRPIRGLQRMHGLQVSHVFIET